MKKGMPRNFPHYPQLNASDCGAVCLQMISHYYGRLYSIETLKAMTQQTDQGATLLHISEAAEELGMHAVGARLDYSRLIEDIPLPGIAHWKDNHFVVVVAANSREVTIADPAEEGVLTIPKSVFLEGWIGHPDAENAEGIILLMEPTADFYSKETRQKDRSNPWFLWEIFKRHRRLLWFLGIGLFIGGLLAITFPFILQTMVDESIEHQNEDLLRLILVAWIVLFVSQLGLDFIRRFILFHIGSKVNIQLLTDFMIKLLRLPVGFFQSRKTEDVIQTLYDNPRVQQFFTKEAVSLVYSSFLLLLFSLVLLVFSWKIFLVFIFVSALQVFSTWYFLKGRKNLNYDRHNLAAEHYGKMNDLIRGIRDIKLSNAEREQRWSWERSLAKLYQVSKSSMLKDELSLQIPFFLGELRNIVIIYMAAKAVIAGEMSIGVLVAVVFLLLQLGNPLRQLINFFLGWKETQYSLERMNIVHSQETGMEEGEIDILPKNGSLEGENVSFHYEGSQSPWIIRHLDFKIPLGKTTVIAGQNGSGKTTLLNLMLNFLQAQEGIIKLGNLRLSNIQQATWLSRCGVAPQDGHIFNDSIARNIALGDEVIDNERLVEAARIANLLPFLERLARGFYTKIGEGGMGLSRGQKQAILIARAVYRQPDFLFLDEPTNDLDAESEKIVLERIQKSFAGKTIVVFASRMNLPIRMDQVIPLSVVHSKDSEYGGFSEVRGGKASVDAERKEGIPFGSGELKI